MALKEISMKKTIGKLIFTLSLAPFLSLEAMMSGKAVVVADNDNAELAPLSSLSSIDKTLNIRRMAQVDDEYNMGNGILELGRDVLMCIVKRMVDVGIPNGYHDENLTRDGIPKKVASVVNAIRSIFGISARTADWRKWWGLKVVLRNFERNLEGVPRLPVSSLSLDRRLSLNSMASGGGVLALTNETQVFVYNEERKKLTPTKLIGKNNINGIVFCPQGNGCFLVADGNYLYRSANCEGDWETICVTLDDSFVISKIIQVSQEVYMVAETDGWRWARSTDNCKTWTTGNGNYNLPASGGILNAPPVFAPTMENRKSFYANLDLKKVVGRITFRGDSFAIDLGKIMTAKILLSHVYKVVGEAYPCTLGLTIRGKDIFDTIIKPTYGNGVYMGLSDLGDIFFSRDGVTWLKMPKLRNKKDDLVHFLALVFHRNHFIGLAVSHGGCYVFENARDMMKSL
jgi:hypothetical protein